MVNPNFRLTALVLLCLFATSCDILQEALKEVNLQQLADTDDMISKKLLKEKPPITTSFETHVQTEASWLDRFTPPTDWYKDANTLARTENGAYFLHEGLFFLETNSFCIKAGTYGPSQGNGYVYAPLDGPQANIIRKLILESYERDDISQSEVQTLIWAIIAKNKFSDMSETHRQTAQTLLTTLELQQLNGGLWGLVPESAKQKAMESVSPSLQRVYQAEAQLRGLLNQAGASYQQFEQVAVLAGLPAWGEEIRPTPSGRWAYHPNGFFIRFIPHSYQRTRVELYVPQQEIINTNQQGRISRIGTSHLDELLFKYQEGNRLRSITWHQVEETEVRVDSMLFPPSVYLPTYKAEEEIAAIRTQFNLQLTSSQYSILKDLLALISYLETQENQALLLKLYQARDHYLLSLLQENTDFEQETSRFKKGINKLAKVNQLNFKQEDLSAQQHLVYDPTTSVATPAHTGRQRLAISPSKPGETASEGCTRSNMDSGKEVQVYGQDGLRINGSKEFAGLIGHALQQIKKQSPELYEQYFNAKGKNSFPLTGVGLDCSIGYNTIDKHMMIRVAIKDEARYKFYLKYPDLLASVLVHEATHIHQAKSYMDQYNRSFTDWMLSYAGENLARIQQYEREAMNNQLKYISAAIKKYPRTHPYYKVLYESYQTTVKRINSAYPDMNDDGVFDKKDAKILRGDTDGFTKEAGMQIRPVQ